MNMKGSLFVLLFICVQVVLTTEPRYCAPGDTSPGCNQCPPDHAWVNCDIDPCKREEEFGCPLHKNQNATCISNQCGGCNDMWYLPNGSRVWCWGP